MRRALLVLAILAAIPSRGQTFTPVSSMAIPRTRHTATKLHDGHVLIVGGSLTSGLAEAFDPATGRFEPAGSLAFARYAHTASLLPDGRVLIAGGDSATNRRSSIFGTYGTNTTEIFDPVTQTFSPGPPMMGARFGHTATTLADGRVLITGGSAGYVSGFSYSIHPTRATEMYDPRSNTFSPGPDMAAPRSEHTSTMLRDGRILLVGSSSSDYAEKSELRDDITVRPSTENSGRSSHSATVLHDGRVLVAGGEGDNGSGETGVAEIYDPASGTFSRVSNLQVPRQAHTASLLPNGNVLIAGGSDYRGPTAIAELFDPRGGRFITIGTMIQARAGHTATALDDGNILLAGGGTSTAEIARPPIRRRALSR